MSIADAEAASGPRRSAVLWSSTGFIALLVLALFWPDPVMWLNEKTVGAELPLNERSFLGREAPSWDIVFWTLAGLYTLSLFHGRLGALGEPWSVFKSDLKLVPARISAQARSLGLKRPLLAIVVGAALIALTWLFLDGPLVVIAESARTEEGLWTIRLLNRLGGGMNPLLLIGFFALGGVALCIRRWWQTALAMACAGIAGGLGVQVLKIFVDRTRPELWLGPYSFIASASSSFPSGHTVGAFALAGVLIFSSRSFALRVFALLAALGIGMSRVVAFRHWPSDVIASGLIGLGVGWFFTAALIAGGAAGSGSRTRGYDSSSAKETETRREHPASSIVTP
ncbi:MAG: phosphatase PAP2 family protein [Acidobacteriota bacterium]